MKTQFFKIHGMQQKQSLEGSSERYRSSSRNKKKKNQPNLLPKIVRKRKYKAQSQQKEGRKRQGVN